MYSVTLQVSARKTESHGFFSNEEVATHVAAGLSGYDADDGNGPVCGVVNEIEIDMSTSVEEYEATLAEAAELSQREQWARFYEDLSDEQKSLMAKFAPASLQDA